MDEPIFAVAACGIGIIVLLIFVAATFYAAPLEEYKEWNTDTSDKIKDKLGTPRGNTTKADQKWIAREKAAKGKQR